MSFHRSWADVHETEMLLYCGMVMLYFVIVFYFL